MNTDQTTAPLTDVERLIELLTEFKDLQTAIKPVEKGRIKVLSIGKFDVESPVELPEEVEQIIIDSINSANENKVKVVEMEIRNLFVKNSQTPYQ